VNTLATYLLTGLIEAPARLIYLRTMSYTLKPLAGVVASKALPTVCPIAFSVEP
jgi:hypothetical protein